MVLGPKFRNDYYWSDGMVVSNKIRIQKMLDVLNRDGEFGKAKYNSRTNRIEFGIHPVFVSKESAAKELVMAARELIGKETPVAAVTVGHDRVSFRVEFGPEYGDLRPATGTEPYGQDPMRAIEKVFKLIRGFRVHPYDVDILV